MGGPRLIQRRLLPRSRHGLKLIKIRSRLGLRLIQSKPLGSRKSGKHTTPLSLMMKMRKKLGPGTRMRTSQTTSKTGMLLTQRKPLGSRLTQRSPRPRSPHGLKPTQRKLPGSKNSGRRSIQTEMETGTGMTKKMSLQKKSSKLPGRSGLLPTQIKPHGPRLIQRRLLPRSRRGLKLIKIRSRLGLRLTKRKPHGSRLIQNLQKKRWKPGLKLTQRRPHGSRKSGKRSIAATMRKQKELKIKEPEATMRRNGHITQSTITQSTITQPTITQSTIKDIEATMRRNMSSKEEATMRRKEELKMLLKKRESNTTMSSLCSTDSPIMNL